MGKVFWKILFRLLINGEKNDALQTENFKNKNQLKE